MSAIKRITIPQPCQESWQQMIPASGGRHCENCCKTVVDFTRMSDAEIIAYLCQANNVCGRFIGDQLPRVNQSLQLAKSRRKIWKRLGVAAFIAGLFSTVKVDAQVQKMTHAHNARHFVIKEDIPASELRTDSLFAKTLTADKIAIDTKPKPIDTKDFTANIDHPLVGYLIGGIQVRFPIVVDDWRNSGLPLRVLFKY